MKAFKFRLEAFLRLKEEIEKQKVMLHAQALRIKQEAKEKVENIELQIRQTEAAWAIRQQKGSIEALDIQREQVYQAALRGELNEAIQCYDFAEVQAQENCAVLVKARQEREILEALKKNQKTTYKQEAMRREEKAIEDLIQARWHNTINV